MKILLSITVALTAIFGGLFMVGYTGKQMETVATNTANSAYAQLVNWINENQNTIISVIAIIIVILIILFFFWANTTTTTTTSYGGY